MPKIIWDDSFSVGSAEIDKQHQKWIQIHNNLHDAIIGGKTDSDTTKRILKEMIDYCNYHFTEEEKYMKEIEFYGFSSHAKIHAAFAERLAVCAKKVESGTMILNRDLIQETYNWLTHHILIEDKKLISPNNKGDV